jgi:hypothetical protein
MKLDSGWQQALLAEIRAVAADDSRVVAVQAYGSVASGQADEWSDLDVAVRVSAGTAGAIANPRWLSKFGRVWASDASANSSRSIVRAVYADGRRLDLTVADAGRTGLVLPPTLDRLAARTTRVRFSAALAVVKAVRGDLLIATHLTLGLLRDCLELALLLRDQSVPASRDRVAAVVAEAPGRVAALLAAGAEPTAVLDALAGVGPLYDGLAAALDPTHEADWSGLEALLTKARAAGSPACVEGAFEPHAAAG